MLELGSRIDTRPPPPDRACAGVAAGLIGPGNVGSRVLDLMSSQRPQGLGLYGVINSSRMVLSTGDLAGQHWQELLNDRAQTASVDELVDFVASVRAGRHVLIDVTASAEVAARHAEWLGRGFEVVTANKWAAAGELQHAPDLNNPRYRHATTVGAGLPILQTLRALRRAGDRLLSIEGVLSGTLSYLSRRVADGEPFSRCVVTAHQEGMTEPDPRLDLGGVDVARKLVIAARAGGLALRLDQVEIDSLIPPAATEISIPEFLAGAEDLDRRWREAAATCPGQGSAIAHVGQVTIADDGCVQARVGLKRLPAAHPLAAVLPGDNIVAIRTQAYRDQPIWIRGPGAGADITALQVWSEVVQAAGA